MLRRYLFQNVKKEKDGKKTEKLLQFPLSYGKIRASDCYKKEYDYEREY